MSSVQKVDKLIQMINDDEQKETTTKLNIPCITLNDDNKTQLPLISLGLYKIEAKDMKRVLKCAYENGYRHFDCASVYKNEKAFGDAFASLNIPRESVIITSKVWNDMQGYESTIKSCLQSLKDCQCNYFDFYLPHWPLTATHINTYKALLKLKQDGKIKFIGLSNYLKSDYETLLSAFKDNKDFILPLINQIWINPIFYDCDKINYFQSQNIAISAYKPLQRGDDRLLKNKIILQIAKKYNITPAQLCIKFCVMKKCIVVVKSSNNKRIIENINALKCVDISNDDMKQLEGLTTNENLKEMHERYLWRMSITKLEGNEEKKQDDNNCIGYLTVHVFVHVKKENVKEFIDASIENAKESVKEDGVFRFDLIQDNDDEQRFMLVEVYKNNNAPAQHKQTKHYKKWKESVAPWMESPRSAKKYTDIFPVYSKLNK
eukprot:213980_1